MTTLYLSERKGKKWSCFVLSKKKKMNSDIIEFKPINGRIARISGRSPFSEAWSQRCEFKSRHHFFTFLNVFYEFLIQWLGYRFDLVLL